MISNEKRYFIGRDISLSRELARRLRSREKRWLKRGAKRWWTFYERLTRLIPGWRTFCLSRGWFFHEVERPSAKGVAEEVEGGGRGLGVAIRGRR